MGRETRRTIDATTALIAGAVIALLVVAGDGVTPESDAAPPPAGGFAHGAAGSGRNGVGGSIAPSPTMRSWPGTGADGNGGPFAFIGAHYGSMWRVPASANNSRGVGYCVMEDVSGEGVVSAQPDPAAWDAGEMARAAAVMSTFGGDRVVPYGIDASGTYDVASGEWQEPSLLGGGEYTRRRHVAVNFAVKMFLDDVSPTGAVAGLKLARDTAVVDGSGADHSALRNGYTMAQRMAAVADAQHAVGGVRLEMVWATGDGSAPTAAGDHPLEVRVTDANGKPVGYVPVVALSEVGIGRARTVDAVAHVDRRSESPDDSARRVAAVALGWPTMDMAGALTADRRFGVGSNSDGAAIADADGIARFDVTIPGPEWELAFHTQAPTADVTLHAGTGIQGQVTWTGPPQSASVHTRSVRPPPTTVPPTTAPATTVPTTTVPPTTVPPTTVPPTTVSPTTVSAPVVQDLFVRKALDADDVQGDRDMSGFEFELSSTDDNSLGRLTTDSDGITQPIEAPAGTYTVTEVGAPPWAAGLDDGGPISFAFDPDGGDHAFEVVYTNLVPDASITTSARDAVDGDQMIDLADGDATVVDTVDYAALVPGTEYLVSGELMVPPTIVDSTTPGTGPPGSTEPGITSGVIDAENSDSPIVVASSTVALAEMIPTGITGTTTFVPTTPDGNVAVTFAVPADSPLVGHAVVVFQRVAVASSGRIVAVHADPTAVEQTIRFAGAPPPPTTTAPTTPAPPTTPTTTATTATAATAAPTTSIVTANPPPPTTTTAAPTTTTATPTTTGPARHLPRTGGGSHSITAAAIMLVTIGVGLVLTTALRPAGRHPTSLADSVRHQRNR